MSLIIDIINSVPAYEFTPDIYMQDGDNNK